MKKQLIIFLSISLLATFFASSFLSSSALADVKANAWELTGFGGLYLMEGNQWQKDTLCYGGKIGYFLTRDWAMELTIAASPTEYALKADNQPFYTALNGHHLDLYHYRFEFLYHFKEAAGKIVPYIALGSGLLHLNGHDIDNQLDTELCYGLGMKIQFLDNFAFRVDARHLIILDKWTRQTLNNNLRYYQESTRFNNLEVVAGFSLLLGGKPLDSDGDGIKDKLDICPNTPAGVKVDARGCPLDSDKDHVFDGIDQCPNTPPKAWVDKKGCPKDTDGDKVLDGIDLCPDTPSNAEINADGCPLDSDGDGVFNGLDRCPKTLAGLVVDDNGCPLDSDGDGVLDGVDRCPDTKPGDKIDPYGCSIIMQKKEIILHGITFKSNSFEITTQSFSLLNEVAKTLRNHPNIVVEIGGHTDSIGAAAYNKNLSLNRAESVKRYLVIKEVPTTQIKSKGYGEVKPIATNKTREGRAKNRRIEFKVISR